jgi:hypothetical protein
MVPFLPDDVPGGDPGASEAGESPGTRLVRPDRGVFMKGFGVVKG